MKILKKELFQVCGNPRVFFEFDKGNKEKYNPFLFCVGAFVRIKKTGITPDEIRKELVDKGLLLENQMEYLSDADIFFIYTNKKELEKNKEQRDLFVKMGEKIKKEFGEVSPIDYDELYRLGKEEFIKRYGNFHIEGKEDSEIKTFKVSRLISEKEFDEEGYIEI